MFRYYRLFVLILTVLVPAALTLAGCGQKGPLYLADESGQPVQELDDQTFGSQRKEGLKVESYQGGFLPGRDR